MLTPSLHEHKREDQRLAALHSCQILDTPPEPSFDELCRLAAEVSGAPMVLVSFVDRHRQWCKARIGLDLLEMPRDRSFCGHAILGTGPFVVEDAAADERFSGNALVTGRAQVRSYAGLPLFIPGPGEPLAIGTLCVMDRVPRSFDQHVLSLLGLLAGQAGHLLEARRTIWGLKDALATTQVKESELRERDLLASEEKFRVLFEDSSDAHLIFDESGIIDCNPAAIAMLRCRDKHEVLNLHPAQLSPERQPDGRASMEKCIEMDARARAHGFHRFDWVHRRLDGEDFPVEVTLTPVTLSARPAMLVLWHDLTERKRVEDELRRAMEAAEAASRAKAEFLAVMSHELRTPMNGVIGMTEMLLSTPLSGKQREFAHTVKSCSEALLALINDILDFSRLEAGQIHMESIPFSPRGLVEDSLMVVMSGAEQRGIELVGHVLPEVPENLIGDPARIRQILLNLVGNAVKFTQQGEVVVGATCTPAGEPGRVVLRLSVRDTGIGIPAEAQERIFQAFSQVDSYTTRRYGGTGLGLAICRRLSQAMGGTVELASQVGRGSQFTLSVPLLLCQPAPPAPAPDLRGRRVLLADDNEASRRMLREELTHLGAVVDEAGDGAGALRLLAGGGRGRYHLAIVDGRLPDMEGLALAWRLRARVPPTPGGAMAIPALPIILLTSLGGGIGDAATCATVSKPVRRHDLLAAVQASLGLTEALPEAERDEAAARAWEVQPLERPCSVLVVDDNGVNCLVVAAMLEKLGCHPRLAETGQEALDALSEAPFDLVLMDCQMPGMDGYELTRIIRAGEAEAAEGERQHLPIIALTANALAGDRERCLRAGMDDYLTKPVTIEVLGRTIERWS